MKILALHGNNYYEKQFTKPFLISVEMFIKSNKNNFKDRLNDTISYSDAIKIIVDITKENVYNLIETLAENIAKVLFCEFKKLITITVSVKKPFAPVCANFEYVAVEITRNRDDFCE